jgi:lysine 2,3-aminomutase
MEKSAVIRDLHKIKGLSSAEAEILAPVVKEFTFRVSSYYAELVNWSDPNDPLRQIVLPQLSEMGSPLGTDASDEAQNTKVQGLQHKYRPTALLLVNDFCAAYCRFCFRKRFTLAAGNESHILIDSPLGQAEKETTFDVTEGLRYIADHPEIDNVILTGGDPLMLGPSRLVSILDGLRRIDHIRVVRIGSKVPAFDPSRITQELLDTLAGFSQSGRQIVLMAHFNHPRELTAIALERLAAMLAQGITIYNQTPLLRGINAEGSVLADLFSGLISAGVVSYYLLHCRPVTGNEPFMTTVQEGLAIVQRTRRRLNGLARGFRYVASHESGKIEVVGQVGDQLVFRFHEARIPEEDGEVFTWPADQMLTWFDEPVQRYRSVLQSP